MANIIQKIINFVFHVDSAIADATGGGLPTFNINNPLAVGGNIEDILDKIITDLLMPAAFPWRAYVSLGRLSVPYGRRADKKITTAKQTLIWTTIGVMVILAAKGIVIVVKDLLTP
jgi:hypothetical protein